MIYDFVNKLLEDPKIKILGDGNQVKSYLDVRDGVKGVLDISEKQKNISSIFNLGHYQTMPVIKLADIVCDQMNLKECQISFCRG